jgi:4-amino-4-deoxy-L-arabinose transferase-like glycosyltransferase
MRQQLLYPAVIVGAGVLVFFTNLGSAALWDDDEPNYAACAREMLDRNDWVVPTYNGSLFPQKPPLMYWTMIVGFKLFGIHEFGARCGAALFGIATALGTYALGRRLFAPGVGLLGGLIVVSTFIFTISARAATVDSALALLSVGAMLAFV